MQLFEFILHQREPSINDTQFFPDQGDPHDQEYEGHAADVLAGHLLGFPLKPDQSFEVPVASYTFEHKRFGWETIPPLMDRASPMRTTHLRDPYGPPILFGSESFMDDVAAATGTDPVEFRLRYLTHPRDRDAVRIAAEQYGWRKRPSPRSDQKDSDAPVGRGIAYRRHFTTFIALIAYAARTCQPAAGAHRCASESSIIPRPPRSPTCFWAQPRRLLQRSEWKSSPCRFRLKPITE
jgi:hypothetical protein